MLQARVPWHRATWWSVGGGLFEEPVDEVALATHSPNPHRSSPSQPSSTLLASALQAVLRIPKGKKKKEGDEPKKVSGIPAGICLFLDDFLSGRKVYYADLTTVEHAQNTQALLVGLLPEIFTRSFDIIDGPAQVVCVSGRQGEEGTPHPGGR